LNGSTQITQRALQSAKVKLEFQFVRDAALGVLEAKESGRAIRALELGQVDFSRVLVDEWLIYVKAWEFKMAGNNDLTERNLPQINELYSPITANLENSSDTRRFPSVAADHAGVCDHKALSREPLLQNRKQAIQHHRLSSPPSVRMLSAGHIRFDPDALGRLYSLLKFRTPLKEVFDCSFRCRCGEHQTDGQQLIPVSCGHLANARR
jgi:hypothetical protein